MEFLFILAVALVVMVPVAFIMAFSNRKKIARMNMEMGTLLHRTERNARAISDLRAAAAHSSTDTADPAQAAPQTTESHFNLGQTEEAPPPDITEPDLTKEETGEDQEAQKLVRDLTYGRKAAADIPDYKKPNRKHTSTAAAAESVAPKSARAFEEIEGDLSTKWMIWIGGIALALGGGFLVKYSIDAGLLHPAVRVSLGVLFGLALTVGGETIRRRSADITWLNDAPTYLPGAITAAGLFTLFASVYSAYALYHLIPAMIAFTALAGISFAASALAYAQGRFFAYLGLVAGMTVPALVSTSSGNPWALFSYLLTITAATLAVARQRGWSGVAGGALLMGSLWAVLWIFTNWHTGDGLPVGLFLLILGGLNSWLLSGATPERSTDATFAGLVPMHNVSIMSDGVTLLVITLLASIIRLEHYSTLSLTLFSVAVIAQAYAVLRDPEHDMGGLAALAASLFLLITWHVPDLFEMQQAFSANEAMNFAMSPIAPPGFATFTSTAVLLAGGFGFGIYFALPWLLRKPLWATVGAAYPLTVLVITYGRLNDFDTSFPFAGVAVAMAGLFTAAIVQLNKLADDKMHVPVAAYAAGATSALALALTMLLRDAWLSTALAIEVVALAHIWRMSKVEGLRKLALGLAAIVLVRLLFNMSIFDYASGGPLPVINWLFYGYGLTALLFAYAGKLFDTHKQNDQLVSVLKAGAALLAVAFVSLEIRVLFGKSGHLLGGMTAIEAAMQTVNWSIATTILFWRETKDGNKLFGNLRRFMTLLSLFGLLVMGGLWNNILFAPTKVSSTIGSLPIFNLQLLQFLVPGLLYAFKARIAQTAGKERSQSLYGAVAFLTIFLWITVEVRHFFHPGGGFSATGDWEWYAYSVAWLLYSVALLFSGIKLEVRKVRIAGLGLLAVVVLKVFLFDMNNLNGIARALSFMGLGTTLIGLGFLYQYFKQADRTTEGAPDN